MTNWRHTMNWRDDLNEIIEAAQLDELLDVVAELAWA